MPTIKSIKLIKTYPGCPVKLNEFLPVNTVIGDTICWANTDDSGRSAPFFERYPEYFQIEYEPETPKLLKRADGSIISEPEEGTEILWIKQHSNSGNFTVELLDKNGMRWMNKAKFEKSLYQKEIRNGWIFLPEDEALAEKKAQQLTKQLEIQYEIDRLNAMEWSDISNSGVNRDYRLAQDTYGHIIFQDSYYRDGTTRMSEATAETILAKYSQEDLKAYLNV